MNVSTLSGARVVIFGGGSGIGYSVAKKLLQSNTSLDTLLVVGSTEGKLVTACTNLSNGSNSTCKISHAVVDMTDEKAMQAFYSQYPEKHFHHIIVTAGRSAFLGNVVENKRTTADLRKQMDLKFYNQMTAVLNGHEKVVDKGSFVLFSGILSQRPGHGNTSLSIANAAVEASVRGLANDLGFSRGIRINCVSPGMTDTDTYAKMGEENKNLYMQKCREKSPLHRIASPDDVADSVLYLMSNPNVTGQVIVNDAGLSGM